MRPNPLYITGTSCHLPLVGWVRNSFHRLNICSLDAGLLPHREKYSKILFSTATLQFDSMSSTQTFATADNVGPAVNVITWLLGVAVVLFVIARLTTKVYLAQALGLDDSFIITAAVSTMPICSRDPTDAGHQFFSIGLVVTVSLEIRNGLGQHESDLLPWQLAGFQKVLLRIRENNFLQLTRRLQTAYAGDILYIISLSFSKFAVLLLIHRITPVNAHQLLISGAAVISLLWSLTGLFAAAFQCQVPKIWEILEGKCFGQVWLPFGTFCRLSHRSDIICPGGILDVSRGFQHHY